MKMLRNMSIFAQIVEAGSITEAAAALDLSKSVVSQHLSALESELGVLLIKRSTRKHTLTSAGRAFYQSCQEINRLSDFAWQQAQDATNVPKGKVTITAPNALMDAVIAPAIGKLVHQYPQLQPQLISADSQLDLMTDNIDLAIRVGESPVSNIKQRRIGEFRDVLCGTQRLLAKTEATQASYIANTWQPQHITHELHDSEGNQISYQATAQCRANSFYACLALIKQGAGIGLVPDFHFCQLKPLLVEAFPSFSMTSNRVYALHTYDNYLPASISVCINAIEEQFSQLSAQTSG
ncbi:LysR family transcriptional regulator [Thalassotalea euphylliae]|uniref:LysR family transcriptional regulator n=1 Tax=Thalassotalea euphylliae TaxID=1655234 RepID=A0A3E0TNA3_9GAMM|nr:LysR family transcriptional regulator [Thalassotalea euphylliae]REL25495.1 LysR family transcriptional regulator [Thalassotalea euphylliae]